MTAGLFNPHDTIRERRVTAGLFNPRDTICQMKGTAGLLNPLNPNTESHRQVLHPHAAILRQKKNKEEEAYRQVLQPTRNDSFRFSVPAGLFNPRNP